MDTASPGPVVTIQANFICGSPEIFDRPLKVNVSTSLSVAKVERGTPSWA